MHLELYRAWKHKNKTVGCVFARLMAGSAAKNPARFGHRAELITGVSPTGVAAEIDAKVNAAVAEAGLNGLALVMPDVTALDDLARIALELEQKPDWIVTRSLLQATPVGDVVAFHMARRIPFGTATCPSEALVLGPFKDVFPATRCAPVTALEIYVGTPPSTDFRGNPTTKAHLALIDVGLSPEMTKKMAGDTKALRLESLGGIDDARAKAKVAFCVPVTLATSLGCAP